MAAASDDVTLPDEGRHHLLRHAAIVFNAFGPRNELVEEAFTDASRTGSP